MRGDFRRGVTPAIATMVLLTATLVLSLIFGAYSSSLFRPNANRIQLSAIMLNDGSSSDNASSIATASLTLSIKNPDLATSVNSLMLSSPALQIPITSWVLTEGPESNNSLFVAGHNVVGPGTTTNLLMYPVQAPVVSVIVGSTYDYLIQFSNGQSISGAIVAQ